MVEGVGGTEQRLLIGFGVEVGEARVSKSRVELLGFEKGKRSITPDGIN